MHGLIKQKFQNMTTKQLLSMNHIAKTDPSASKTDG